MEKLLKRWAELEPERCRIERDSPKDSGPVFFISCIPPKPNPDEVYASIRIQTNSDGSLFTEKRLMVQGIVQELVINRGWSIRLEIGPETANGHVTTDCSVGGEVYASTPAEVALTAYLNALEALAHD